MTPVPGTLAPGVTLQNGRYVIERPLGKGGMGKVFLARDCHVNNKLVAIKELAIDPSVSTKDRAEAEAEFVAEMQTLAALSHPNIPEVSDFFVEGNGKFIVQDYVAGQDLQKALNAVQVPGSPPVGLPEKQVLAWASQVLAALDFLEHQTPPVIHRDIKPGNIIVTALGRAYLVDFGIAIHKFTPGTPRAALQQPYPPAGTPGYAPQEQYLGQETVLSDLYALGATMHQLLTGRDPTTAQPLFFYPPVRQLAPQVTASTEYIVRRALQDPGQRYQSAADMKRDVDLALTPPATRPAKRPPGQGRALALLVGFLLVAVVATDVYEHLKGPPPPPPQKRTIATSAPPTATAGVVVPAAPTATPTAVPTATATAVPSVTTTATPVPTTTPLPPPTPSVGHELRRVNVMPTTSATFTTADNMIVDGDVRYPDFPQASSLPGDRTPPVTDIGRVAYTARGGQVAAVPLGNGATTVQFSGPIPESTVDKEVQVPLSQHGCLGTCDAIQVWYFNGSTVLSTCVHQGEHFHTAELTASPDPPCL